MLKKLKTLLALALLLCLFLPLAQCSSEKNQFTDRKEITLQVIDVQDFHFSWPLLIPVFIFALPLLLLLSRWFLLRWRLRYFFVDSLANLLVMAWLWLLQILHQWLYGAWLAFGLCVAMLCISVLEIVIDIRRNRRFAAKQ